MYQRTETYNEVLEAEYLKSCGEKMALTIAETWADAITLHKSRNRERRREVIVSQIVKAIEGNMSDLEIAETAASLVGNPGFEEYAELRS